MMSPQAPKDEVDGLPAPDDGAHRWDIGRTTLELGPHGTIMGILNVTPDSFSDGGRFVEPSAAVDHALGMVAAGAGIIDIGGESTRPGAAPVDAATELARTIPVVRALRAQAPELAISIDTSKAEVAARAIDAGADIVNDVTALRGDPRMGGIVASTGAGCVLMHMQGQPRTMQRAPRYRDVVAEVTAFLGDRIRAAEKLGIPASRLCLDPGIGFGKGLDHNLELLRNLSALRHLNRPVLLGVSRKSFIGRLLVEDAVDARAWPTVALTAFAREHGVRVIRVHDVRPNAEALRMTEAVLATGAG